MNRKFLVIDKEFADANNIEDCVSLLPNFDYQPNWSLDFALHTKQYHETVRLKDDLANHFAKEIYSPALGYKVESCENLFLNYGTLVVFVLCDRLLRLNKLFEEVSSSELQVPHISFEINKKWTFGYLYYQKVEKDPLYNQWIINRLLPDIERGDFKVDEKLKKPVYGEFYSYRESYLVRLIRNLREGTLFSKLRNYLVVDISKFFLFLSRYINKIPIDDKNVNFLAIRNSYNYFFWPFGKLAPLESREFETISHTKEIKINRAAFLEHSEYVSNRFKEFLDNCQGNINLPDSSFQSITDLIYDHLPLYTTEHAETYCSKYIEELKPYKGSFFIVDGTGANTLKSLRMFAAKELDIPVVATQHSGWGGYLANGALVNEILISRADYYLTFGWTNRTPGETSWLKKAVTMPSPLLSNFERKYKEKRFMETNTNQVLISLGFIYRFPAIHNSFLRLDILNKYVEVLEDILKVVHQDGWGLTLSFYNSQVEEFFKNKIEEWKSSESFKINFLPDNDIKLRSYMQLDKFDSLYDAVIWDIPAGGFAESLAIGKKTFSLFNEELIKPTDEAKPFIHKLKEQGILFSNSQGILQSLKSLRHNSNWYLETKRVKSIDAFRNQYFKTSESWEDEWKFFIENNHKYLN
tara:strand:+ start:37134 stop:39050 length:1917 start_codon:yes stop_codon:yes gene_type:complete